MKRFNKPVAGLLFACAILPGVSAAGATLPSGWQHEQSFDVATVGLVKINLPVETLDAARPLLEDLRLYDDSGNEVSYLIERPMPVAKAVQTAKSLQISLEATSTVITLETGLAQPLDGVTLESPAMNFIKAVRVENSDDGKQWQVLTQGQPVFRQSDGASHLRISFPASVSKWLRLTVDDQRSRPVPFTGALLHAAAAEAAPEVSLPAAITSHDENPGETRLALRLGAANLNIATVRIESSEPLFMRQVSIAVPKISEDSIREQTVGQGAVYRVAIDGQTPSENLSVPVEDLIRSREFFLLIKNGDSPPVPISAVRVERRPVYFVFFARQPGAYHLLTGNALCAAPRYDLGGLDMNLKGVAISPIHISPPSDNPDFRAPDVLPGLEVTGTPLDVSEWRFRKAVKIASGGAQQLELDIDVLAHAQRAIADLRVLHGSNQVPYIIQSTSIRRALTPVVTATNDVKQPKLSRWIIKLPRAGLPLTRLTCMTRTPLFERSLSLYEELADERGNIYRRPLSEATWTQTPEFQSKGFALTIDDALRSDTLYLETENGDNPPIELENFQVFYAVTRLLFKTQSDDKLFLYYGNPHVAPPSYDLSLVADQLLTAGKNAASLLAEEQLEKSSWRENQKPGQGGAVFWGVMIVVVVVLLVTIARLLPKSQAATK